MNKLILGLNVIFLSFCGHPSDTAWVSSGGRNPGEFKGLAQINAQLRQRILAPFNGNNDGFDLSRSFGPAMAAVSLQLGKEQGGDFHNGKLSAFALSLWYQLHSGLAHKLWQLCQSEADTLTLELTVQPKQGGVVYPPGSELPKRSFPLKDSFATALKNHCQAHDVSSWQQSLRDLWQQLLAEDFPTQKEWNIFQNHFTWQKMASHDHRIKDSIMGMLLHPTFLIAQ